MRSALSLILLAGSLAAAEDFVVFREPADTPGQQLTRYLTAIGQKQLEERRREVAQIKTREQAEQRRKAVREKLLRLMGGLPDYRGPLNVKHYGTLDRGDYRIEKIAYESMAGFHVTANVYVPARGSGPFPAVLMPVGHGRDGKAGSRTVATGLVLKGFIALAYDPPGQGERLQYWDPAAGASRVGGPTDEHSHANGHTMLIGDNVARYFIWDGMRGIDYLLTRKDVDPKRIGCTGCSGGGTITTYIAALDDRVAAAAPACYTNSWEELLPARGPQDAEQTFVNFLSEGLNFGDYALLFAPKPWLIVSTIEDFFPLEGARQTYEEARRFYRLYGAQDRIAWHVGPGPHGTPQPSREAIYAWFIKWLKNGQGDEGEPAVKPEAPQNLLVTATGQVNTALGSETIHTLNRKRAADLIRKSAPEPARLAAEVRRLAVVGVQPGGAPPPVTVHRSVSRPGYRIDILSLESEPGIRLPGLLLTPEGGAAKPAILVADSRARQETAAPGGDLENLAKAGYIVLALQLRGLPETPPARSGASWGGYGASFRAYVVGKTLPGMRIEDVLRAVDYLASRPDVDRAKIAAFGQGAQGVPVLHAALLDPRIGRVVLQETPAMYRMAVEEALHRNLYEVAIPGVLRSYDLDDIVLRLSPRAVTLIDPVDQLGDPARMDELRKQFGAAGHVRLESRGGRPLSGYFP
jgi:cephalosporin-C deacetylase-like acetyl esterase